MPNLKSHHPVSNQKIRRTENLANSYTDAKNAIENITETEAPFKFGISPDEIESRYHFVPYDSVYNFYETYLKQRRSIDVDKTEIQIHISKTVNRVSDASLKADEITGHHFKMISNNLINGIDDMSSQGGHFVRLFIGPTGCGKTAFSKALISYSYRDMWNKRIVPSRVEYSRFSDSNSTFKPKRLITFTRQCQLRDLLLFMAFSDGRTGDENIKLIKNLAYVGSTSTRRILINFFKLASELGERSNQNVSLREMSKLWKAEIGIIDNAICLNLLDELLREVSVRFLVSFDGFDVMKVEEFFLESDSAIPIKYISDLIVRSFSNLTGHGSMVSQYDCHFLVYLRDTTYHRLEIDLRTGPSGRIDLPIRWIIPPVYQSLVFTAAHQITDVADPTKNGASKMCSDIFSIHDKSIFSTDESRSYRSMYLLFSGNGRFMKRHITRILVRALDDISKTRSLTRKGGCSKKDLWNLIITSHAIASLPPYHVLEEIFLDDAQQLCPQLQIDGSTIKRLLDESDLAAAFEHVRDYGETIGFVESLFNYMLKENLCDTSPIGCLPALLLQIRILQHVKEKPGAILTDIHTFLHALGYSLSISELSFVIYCLIRTELLLWDSSIAKRSLLEIPLYIGTRARVIMDKMLQSVTYFSESLMIAELPSNGICSMLKGRHPTKSIWVADCVFNTFIGLVLMKNIEDYELARAKENGVNITNYLLTPSLRLSLAKEIDRIVNSRVPETDGRWAENLAELEKIGIYTIEES